MGTLRAREVTFGPSCGSCGHFHAGWLSISAGQWKCSAVPTATGVAQPARKHGSAVVTCGVESHGERMPAGTDKSLERSDPRFEYERDWTINIRTLPRGEVFGRASRLGWVARWPTCCSSSIFPLPEVRLLGYLLFALVQFTYLYPLAAFFQEAQAGTHIERDSSWWASSRCWWRRRGLVTPSSTARFRRCPPTETRITASSGLHRRRRCAPVPYCETMNRRGGRRSRMPRELLS